MKSEVNRRINNPKFKEGDLVELTTNYEDFYCVAYVVELFEARNEFMGLVLHGAENEDSLNKIGGLHCFQTNRFIKFHGILTLTQ